jgi:hypothetical protein
VPFRFINKSIRTRINKNNNKKGKQEQVHGRDKTKNNKYTKTKNRKKMTNDTNCLLKSVNKYLLDNKYIINKDMTNVMFR